jgi:hypothetical protein
MHSLSVADSVKKNHSAVCKDTCTSPHCSCFPLNDDRAVDTDQLFWHLNEFLNTGKIFFIFFLQKRNDAISSSSCTWNEVVFIIQKNPRYKETLKINLLYRFEARAKHLSAR